MGTIMWLSPSGWAVSSFSCSAGLGFQDAVAWLTPRLTMGQRQEEVECSLVGDPRQWAG